MEIEPALAQLTFMSKAAARPVKKLLESCIANAEHNFKLERDGLYIKSALVNQGPSLKRWRPRAMGSAAPILKRTCHITLVLESKTGAKRAEKPKAKKEEAPGHEGHDHAGHKHDEKLPVLPALSKADAKKAERIKAEEKKADKKAAAKKK
jgi:large subunit ribosomal protein L22